MTTVHDGRAARARSMLGRGCATGALLLLATSTSWSQEPQGDAAKTKKTPKPYVQPPIFTATAPLSFTLTAPFRQLKKERTGTVPYRNAEITYVGDSGEVRVPVRVRPRGIWRRKNCDIPPLRLNFTKDSAKKTVFRHLDGARLVMHCRDNDDYEQYVLQEYQLYRIYRMLSPYSHGARLLHVTYTDSASGKPLMTRYGFVIEELEAIAAREHGKVMKLKGATIDDLSPSDAALVGVFEYLIGNTDFSITGLHNAELLAKANSGEVIPIAYDFDFSGAVNTRYATPDPRLRIRVVRQRLYRGYCVPDSVYTPVFALFNAKKDSIYGWYSDKVGQLMDPKIARETLQYFDEFYKTINNPGDAKNEIIKSCIGRGG